jgi:hypothetical protein
LLKVRPILLRQRKQILQWHDRVDPRHLNAVCRYDTRLGYGRTGDPRPAQGALDDRLLLQQGGLAVQELLLARGHLRVGADDFDGRQRADLNLLLIVLKQFPGQFQRLLLYFDVFTEANEVPVEVGDRRNRGE